MSRAPSPTVSRPTFRRLGLLPATVGAALLLAPSANAYQLIGATWDTERGPSEYALDSAGSEDIGRSADLAR